MNLHLEPSAAQRRLRADARAFARDVLVRIRPETAHLPDPKSRFLATRPMYEDAIRAGFLRRLIPEPFGGGGSGLYDMAIVAEEFYAVDASVSLTLFANLLGLLPLFIAGTPEQHARFLPPFLATHGAPLAALANSEPGGSANYAAPPPAAARARARDSKTGTGSSMAASAGSPVPPVGMIAASTCSASCAELPTRA